LLSSLIHSLKFFLFLFTPLFIFFKFFLYPHPYPLVLYYFYTFSFIFFYIPKLCTPRPRKIKTVNQVYPIPLCVKIFPILPMHTLDQKIKTVNQFGPCTVFIFQRTLSLYSHHPFCGSTHPPTNLFHSLFSQTLAVTPVARFPILDQFRHLPASLLHDPSIHRSHPASFPIPEFDPDPRLGTLRFPNLSSQSLALGSRVPTVSSLARARLAA